MPVPPRCGATEDVSALATLCQQRELVACNLLPGQHLGEHGLHRVAVLFRDECLDQALAERLLRDEACQLRGLRVPLIHNAGAIDPKDRSIEGAHQPCQVLHRQLHIQPLLQRPCKILGHIQLILDCAVCQIGALKAEPFHCSRRGRRRRRRRRRVGAGVELVPGAGAEGAPRGVAEQQLAPRLVFREAPEPLQAFLARERGRL
mmetsp:Transcript_94055/g.304232  ORF Transcript_94055/g.304232 Transcript_94055/m.304232 type:complete len:204 (+) Transcript_94055:2226-2837(+)